MKYEDEIWKTMYAKMMKPMIDSLIYQAERVGFKFKKGEVKIPATVMMELVEQAYREGARAALKMEEELSK